MTILTTTSRGAPWDSRGWRLVAADGSKLDDSPSCADGDELTFSASLASPSCCSGADSHRLNSRQMSSISARITCVRLRHLTRNGALKLPPHTQDIAVRAALRARAHITGNAAAKAVSANTAKIRSPASRRLAGLTTATENYSC